MPIDINKIKYIRKIIKGTPFFNFYEVENEFPSLFSTNSANEKIIKDSIKLYKILLNVENKGKNKIEFYFLSVFSLLKSKIHEILTASEELITQENVNFI